MIKKYLVIGNPIEHSLSPKLHNHWIKKNNIEAFYDKKKIDENELKHIISKVKEEKISGINITVPFKNAVIPFLDELSPEANETKSVNTIYLHDGKKIKLMSGIFKNNLLDKGKVTFEDGSSLEGYFVKGIYRFSEKMFLS